LSEKTIMAANLTCPKCRSLLPIPQPAPEKWTCPHCHASFRLTARSAAGKAAQAEQAEQAPAAVKTAEAGKVAGHVLQRELARGGLGVIYLAYHPHLKVARAIKRPLSSAGPDSALLRERFAREMQAVGSLRSPHVVAAYDAGDDDEGPYLVMEYLDGEPVSSLLARHGRLPVPEACELIRQAALGLQAAHDAGLVHRDLKPSNLMLTRDRTGSARAVIIDWGLVKQSGESESPGKQLTRIGMDLGTPDYIAPEQIRDPHGVDIRADIYSLGATLYFLLAGKPPFHDRRDADKLLAQTREPFPPLEQIRQDVPRGVLFAIARMVKKDPAERFQSPAEVVSALAPFCAGEPQRLTALLAPVSAAGQATAETKDLFGKETILTASPAPPAATTPPDAAQATAGPNPWLVWGLVGAGTLLLAFLAIGLVVAIIIGVMLQPNERDPVARKKSQESEKEKLVEAGPKDKPAEPVKANLPQVLIDEDFREVYNKKLGIPDGWKSDEFTSFKISELYGIHPVAPTGTASVIVPLSTPLAGNFSIQGVFHMDHPAFAQHHVLTVSLENRKKTTLLPIVFDWSGNVVIAKDAKAAPLGYKPLLPTQFVVKREANKIRVFLDEFPPVEKNFEEAPEFDTLRLGMTAGNGNGGRRLRLHGLKVVVLP
jgi:tRNA A-37 threonylcarbamoyl transferase component Bud32